MRIKLYARCPEQELNHVPLQKCLQCEWFSGFLIHPYDCHISCEMDEVVPDEQLPKCIKYMPKEKLLSGWEERILE